MAFDPTKAGGLSSRRRVGRSEIAMLVLGAVALAAGVAAWIAYPDEAASFATAALPSESPDGVSFHDRFGALSPGEAAANNPALQSLNRRALTAVEKKLWDAKALLAAQLMLSNWRSASASASADDITPSVDEAKSTVTPDVPGIPLPRPRPVVATADTQAAPVAQADTTDQKENRTVLQKLSDLLPGRITLASLTPEIGLFRQKPDLAALGYDKQTAVYDISARTVYLPNGMSLEAHSGMGRLRDDPDHVDQRMLGATPPATYDLKPREKLFHGVAALRMIPADGNTIFGRAGLLTHSFMLGPDGDSNGCVSIRDYDRFLKAFNDGEFNRLVVVPSLSAVSSASPRPTSQS